MPSQYGRYPATVLEFATFASFPSSAPNGQLAVDQSTSTLYIYSTTAMAWEAVGGSGVPLGIGVYDSKPPVANGLQIVANLLYAQSADATHPGMVNASTQTFAGNKTFTGSISASNLSGTNSGDVTLAAVGATPNANAASLSGQILNLQPFDSTHPGVATASGGGTTNFLRADGTWAAPGTGNAITALTGDATATGPGSVPITFATVNGNVGSFGSSTSIPSFTVNGKGLITAASGNVVIAPAGTLSGTTLNSSVVSSSLTSLGAQAQALNMNSHLINNVTDPSAAQDAATKNYVDTHSGTGITALTGDVTATGPGSAAATIAAHAVTNSKLAQIPAHSYKGNNTGSTADAADITSTQLTADLNLFSSTLQGLVPASGGGSTNFLRADGTFAVPPGSGTSVKVAYVRDEKSSGVNGGTFTSGAWRTRTLNTSSDPGSIIVSLSTNQFTLASGTYMIEATAPGYAVDRHQARLQDITNAATIFYGNSEFAQNLVANETTCSRVTGVFVVSGNTAYEIQHQCQTSQTSNGFGIEANFSGNTEVYTQVTITKIV